MSSLCEDENEDEEEQEEEEEEEARILGYGPTYISVSSKTY